MKAQILFGIDNIKYSDVDKPTPKDGEALIKVSRCGICGSDIPRIFKTGAHNMPLIPGHEFMGTVEACDSEPSLVGKRVGIFPLIPCKECDQCKAGHYEMCKNYNYLGSRCDGGYAEYVCAPTWNLLPIPDEVTDDEVAMMEPMCVAVHAVRNIGLLCGEDVDSSLAITICGLGTIGLLLAMFLKDAGYKNIFFIGNKDIQKKKLLEMGFSEEQICDVRYGEPSRFIMDKTGGRGSDIYFECIGRSESYGQAISCTAPLGKVMLVGNPASDMELPRDVYWKILRNQIMLKGTWNSSYLGRDVETVDDWKYVLGRLEQWHKDGNKHEGIYPEALITHRFNLENMQDGLRIMQRKSEEYIKIMVEN